uniref:B30.2/SPRY domain-containing protein n=1 Tax=Oreochromis niloticus TaxID=8128 RepID=I3JI02_ORENI
MSADSNLQSEDRFLCSICLDVFTDPVTTSCGHNFCKKCITQYWDVHERCQCPLCKETFNSRPQLKINTFISEMVAQAVETLRKDMKKLFEAELKRVQQYAVDVTLDPDTANPDLILSDDGKQVKYGDVKKKLPDNPERFSQCVCVLGEQSFSSGRFYFEVQVKGKTKWSLGVATESISRKGKIRLSPQNGLWTVCLRNGNKYKACAVSLQSGPEKVGVFVDYEEGLVSFYDVDAAALIYSFTGCSFTQKLHPYLNPCNNDDGKNAAPLLITPINLILCEDRLD